MLVVGVNHHKTPVAFRERLAFSESAVQSALCWLKSQTWVDEVMILSTCNRSEVYVVTPNHPTAVGLIKRWWCDFLKVGEAPLEAYFFAHWDRAAVQHLARVASGLDSMVLGEPQILGQLKQAYTLAQSANCVGTVLNQVIPHSFNVAKEIRTDTKISEHPVSVAYAAVVLAKRIFEDISDTQALLLGAGEMIQLVARHLSDQGVAGIRILNRTRRHAETLAAGIPGVLVDDIDKLAQHLPNADILISCTASEQPLVHKDMVAAALKQRRHRPIYMMDLAVPRDIDEQVDTFDDVYLFSIDDLSQVIEENKKMRSQAAAAGERIAGMRAATFMKNLTVRKSSALIGDYRRGANNQREILLQGALKQIEQGESIEQVLDQMSRALTNKLIHGPTLTLKNALESQDAQQLGYVEHLLDFAAQSSQSSFSEDSKT